MSLIDQLRASRPDLEELKDLTDSDLVSMYSRVTGASLDLSAMDLGLDPQDYIQNKDRSDDLINQGILGLGDIVSGVAGFLDIPIAGATGYAPLSSAVDWAADATGLSDYGRRLELTMSPQSQQTDAAWDKTWNDEEMGAWDKAKSLAGVLWDDPAYALEFAARSAPTLIPAFGGAKLLGMGAKAMEAAGLTRTAAGLRPLIPGLAEGGVAAGYQMNNLLEEDVDSREAAGYSALTGVGTGLIGGVTGALGARAGLTDPHRRIAGYRLPSEAPALPWYQRIAGGTAMEAGQEALQSPWEQAMTNVATDQPWDQGLARSSVEGAIGGGIIGAPFNVFRGREVDLLKTQDTTETEPQPAPTPPGVNPPGSQAPNIDPLAAERQRQIDSVMGGETSQTVLPGQTDPGSLQDLTRDQINQRLIDAAMGGETARTFAPGQYPSDVAADLSQQQAKVNAIRAAEQAKKAVEKQYEKAGWQKTPEKIALLETAQAPKLVSGIYGDEARKFVDSVLTMDAKTAGELFTNLSSSKSKSAPWKAAVAKAHLTNLAQQEAQTLAQQAKQNDTVDGPGVPVTPVIAQPAEGAVGLTPTSHPGIPDSSPTAPANPPAMPEGATTPAAPATRQPDAVPQNAVAERPIQELPIVPVPLPSPTTPETQTNALSGQTTPQAGQETGTTAPDATPVPGVITSANPSPIQSDQETVPVPEAAPASVQVQGSGNRELATQQGGQAADADQTQAKPTLNFSRSGQGQPAPRFFSQLKRVVERAKQTTMPGGQWKAWLKANQAQLGVKQEEIEATGIDEYLDARGEDKVTREEIAAFVENNGVRVEEVTKESDTAKFDKWQLPGGSNYKELLLTLPTKRVPADGWTVKQHPSGMWAVYAPQGYRLDDLYQSREEALTKVPEQTASAGQYQSSHYSEPNILAHMRINERTDTEGKRVLFVEEIQSDWGQEGRDKGFVPAKGLPEGFAGKRGVVSGPFVTNTKSWTALALKRLMTYAVENGFDRVAWTTGEQQAERYDLSKQISDIAWRGGNFVAWDKQGNEVVRRTGTTQQDVADYVGKEVANKLFSQTPQGEGRNALYQLSGEDLNVGGQGMKAFYDGIVPQVANDLLKKLDGGKVSNTVAITNPAYSAADFSSPADNTTRQLLLENGEGATVHAFDITPAMRAKVQGGLPLFARKPNKAQQRSGNTVADVERWIAGPKAKLAQWVTNGLNVVQSVDELRARYPGMDIPGDVVGMHEGGYVFLVADNITNANQARKALAHEVVGHLGLERMLGKKGFERIVRQIDSYIRTQNPAVLQVLERVKAKYIDDQGKYNLNQVQEASEILAHLAERNPNFGLVREIIARIRMWFAKHGLGNYAAAELNQLLVEAARFTETGFTSFAEGNFRVAPAYMVAGGRPTQREEQTAQPLPETITIDGTNPNINFMRGPTKQDASNLWDWIKTETEAGVEAFSRKVGLGALTNEQMADRWGKEFAPLKTIANVLDATEAKAAQWEKKAEDADRDWAALTTEQDQLMSEIMGDASLHGYDPDTGQLPVGHISKEQRARVMAAKVTLDARWQRLKTLDANGKHKAVAVYRQVRDYHQQRLQEAINYVRAQLQQKGTVLPDDPLLKSLEALEAMGKRPYFPLMRLGDYYVVGMSPQMADLEKRFRAKQLQPDEDALREKLRRDPKHYWVEGTSRLATAKRLAEKLRKEMGFAQYNAERYKLANARSHVGQDVGKFEQALEGMALDTKTHDALVEMYEQLLISALPEHHSLKRTLHREGIYGWDKNMRAVFAKTAQTGAWALSRMMHVSDLQQAMSELDEMSKTGEPNAQDARALHNELLARQDLTFTRYEDPLLVQGAMKFSYLSMLGFSPAFWMINLTQPWMVTLPYLTARNGNEFKATSSALWRGVREAFSMIEASTEGKELRTQFNPDKVNQQGQKVRLTADERRMLDTFGADGTLDFTIGYDLGAIAKGGSGKWQKVMRSINAPTHATELANRVGTALAAYRISRQSQHSHEQALEFAKKAVNTTQVNYNPANKARYMQAWAGNRWLPKLAFQFYTYQQAMAYLALSTLRDAIKGDKVAQSTMAWMTGMLGATGGVFALPFAQMSLGAAGLIFSALGGGDDEEDVDFQRDLRNLFSDHLPEPVARLLNKGLGSMLLQTDLGARIGMGNLMNPLAFARFEAADKGADTVQEVLFRMGGAPVANVANAVDGLSAMRDVMGALVTGDAPKGSDVTDALSKLFPLKGVRDIFRGIELSAEGVTTGEGEPRLTDFSYLETALQSAGITPLRKTMYYERNAAIQGAKEAMKVARGDLIREYAQARLAGEPIGPILAKIGAFNRRNPQHRIDQDTLKRSTTQRQKDRQSLDNGILANKENRPYLAAGRWAE